MSKTNKPLTPPEQIEQLQQEVAEMRSLMERWKADAQRKEQDARLAQAKLDGYREAVQALGERQRPGFSPFGFPPFGYPR